MKRFFALMALFSACLGAAPRCHAADFAGRLERIYSRLSNVGPAGRVIRMRQPLPEGRLRDEIRFSNLVETQLNVSGIVSYLAKLERAVKEHGRDGRRRQWERHIRVYQGYLQRERRELKRLRALFPRFREAREFFTSKGERRVKVDMGDGVLRDFIPYEPNTRQSPAPRIRMPYPKALPAGGPSQQRVI